MINGALISMMTKFRKIHCRILTIVQRMQIVGDSITLMIEIFNIVNHFKEYKRYINIWYPILDLVCPNEIKLILEQQYMLSVLRNQDHVCS